MLLDALGLQDCRLVSLTGAGGKTNLMFALARETVDAGGRALVTTTTKIASNEADSWPGFAAATAEEFLDRGRAILPAAGAVVAWSGETLDGERRIGPAPEVIDEIAAAGWFDRILVEADGSKRLPLKVPAAHEPVVPAASDALIMVAGLNGLGRPLDADHVFRPALWSELTGLTPGQPVGAESLARAVVHPDGLAKGCPDEAQLVLFLNQADKPQRLKAAERVIELLPTLAGRCPGRAVAGWLLPEPGIAATAVLTDELAIGVR
jgi:probable selenium-dependent hydroxylase accessory protein YqeC